MAKADLHIHTTASDGQISPVEVVQEAANLNLATIALTDHDTINGIAEAKEEAKHHTIEVLAGSEITTLCQERECHLLAYGFDEGNEEIQQLLHSHQKARVDRARWIIAQLQQKGLQLDIDEVLAEVKGRNVGRPHIAEVLRKKGYISSIREAFIRHLSNEALGPIESNYHNFDKVITIVKKAGGVMVVAHPGRLYSKLELTTFVDAGIDGLEVIHRSHNYEIQKAMETFAEDHNLLKTGGSDFHGSKKSYYRHFGTLAINSTWVEKIKKLAARRKEISV